MSASRKETNGSSESPLGTGASATDVRVPAGHGTTSTWQPTFRDSTSPTYSRATGGYRAVDVPLDPGSNRRRLWGAGVAIAALALALWALMRPTIPVPFELETVAHIEGIRGIVLLQPPGDQVGPSRLLPLDRGRAVPVGSVMKTSSIVNASSAGLHSTDRPREQADRIGMQLAGGASVRLDTHSRMRLESPTRLVLERGAVYVDGAGAIDVEVQTSLGVVRDIGTQFEVRLVEDESTDGGEPSLRIRVREGRVELRPEGFAGDQLPQASVGEEIVLRADGDMERANVPIHGPDWDWVMSVAKLPEVDGQPVETLLHWIVREGGWQLEYSDSKAETSAETVTLHGDLSDLQPLAAVELALGSSGMAYRLDDGVFHVSLSQPAG